MEKERGRARPRTDYFDNIEEWIRRYSMEIYSTNERREDSVSLFFRLFQFSCTKRIGLAESRTLNLLTMDLESWLLLLDLPTRPLYAATLPMMVRE